MGIVIGLIGAAFTIGLTIFFISVYWKLFVKAGKPGWACIVPIYNVICMLDIIKKGNQILALIGVSIFGAVVGVFIPEGILYIIFALIVSIVEIVLWFNIYCGFFKAYGKGVGYALISIPFGIITIPMMAYSKDTYWIYGENATNQEDLNDDFNETDINNNEEDFELEEPINQPNSNRVQFEDEIDNNQEDFNMVADEDNQDISFEDEELINNDSETNDSFDMGDEDNTSEDNSFDIEEDTSDEDEIQL